MIQMCGLWFEQYVPPSLGVTWTLTQRLGGFSYGFSDSKTYHLGGYGADSGDYYDCLIRIDASSIVGPWSSLTITLNGVVWTGLAVDKTLRLMATIGGSTDYTPSDVEIGNVTMTQGATSVSLTITGTDLQNYFNGVTYPFLYLEWNPNYFSYYIGFDSITFSVS